MTKDEIAKLPTPLSNAHYGEEWDGDGSSLCRSLEQRLAAAVMAMEQVMGQANNIEVLGEWEVLDINRTLRKKYREHIDDIYKRARETLDAIRGDK